MLKQYSLEPPPPVPSLDGILEGATTFRPGRRVRPGEGTITFPGSAVLSGLTATGGSERRFAALEEPCFIWEVTGAGELSLECLLTLPATDLHFERSPDGTRLWLGAGATKAECLIDGVGGVATVVERGAQVLLTVRGHDRLRVVIIGAEGESDRERVLRTLARKGMAGLQAQWRQHDEQVAALRLTMRTPDDAADRVIAETVAAIDASIVEEEGRRSIPSLLRDGETLLALGLREPVRDLLRAGVSSVESVRLFARYGAWVGADDFLTKRWPELERALRDAPTNAEWRCAAEEILPVAEAVGDIGTIAALEGRLARPGEVVATPESPVMTLLRGTWGIVPSALEEMVRLAPALPADREAMTLERLRIDRTTLDVRVRRRPGGLACHCRVTHGPRILVRLAPVMPFTPSGILLDGDQLPGPEVRFILEDEADAIWMA